MNFSSSSVGEVVWTLAAEMGTGYLAPRVKRGNAVLRFKGNRPKTEHGLYGPVTIQRAYYASGSVSGWRTQVSMAVAAMYERWEGARDSRRGVGSYIRSLEKQLLWSD